MFIYPYHSSLSAFEPSFPVSLPLLTSDGFCERFDPFPSTPVVELPDSESVFHLDTVEECKGFNETFMFVADSFEALQPQPLKPRENVIGNFSHPSTEHRRPSNKFTLHKTFEELVAEFSRPTPNTFEDINETVDFDGNQVSLDAGEEATDVFEKEDADVAEIDNEIHLIQIIRYLVLGITVILCVLYLFILSIVAYVFLHDNFRCECVSFFF